MDQELGIETHCITSDLPVAFEIERANCVVVSVYIQAVAATSIGAESKHTQNLDLHLDL